MLLYKNKHLISKVRPEKKAQTVNENPSEDVFKRVLGELTDGGFCVNKTCALGHRFFKFVHVILYHIKIIKEAVWRPDLQTLQSLWKKEESVERLNQILHKYGSYIIGRMGIPHKERGVNIISIAIDAPQNEISSLSGKLGMLEGVTAKAVYSKV